MRRHQDLHSAGERRNPWKQFARGRLLDFNPVSRFQTYFLPVIGLVDAENLKPGDLVGVNKDSYLILETLPAEYDSRVKAMEVDERPTEQYSDIGGLDKQIQELIEAVVLPVTHKERFENLGSFPSLSAARTSLPAGAFLPERRPAIFVGRRRRSLRG